MKPFCTYKQSIYAGCIQLSSEKSRKLPAEGGGPEKIFKKRLHVDEFTPWRYRGNDGVCPPGK
jgi:hypothetical protein